MPDTSTRTAGPLRPIELATASVLATLAVVLTVAGWFLPHLTIIAAFAVVPLGVVAHHHRLRALAAATFSASVLAFLVAGTGSVTNVIECAAVGGLVGVAKRRGWGFGRVLLGTAVIGPVLAAASIALLALFSTLRELTLKQIVNTWHGIRRVLDAVFSVLHLLATAVGDLGLRLDLGVSLPKRHSRLAPIDRFVTEAVHYWWAVVAVVVIGATVWFAILGWVFIGAVLERLQWIRADDRLEAGPDRDRPGPVPVALDGVTYRYPGAEHDALAPVHARIDPGEMVALIGDNGSGKSTLTRILAGRPPSAGVLHRPGGAGLGQPGGTAMVLQHPETQILGVRVADDVVWGLPDGHAVDVEPLLEQVGLGGMADRETSGLSGGELQRLAVAGALARRPRLLISDESTAMVDRDGREKLTALLRDLPGRFGMAVVHVTHRPEEANRADRTYRLLPAVPPAAGDRAPEPPNGAGSNGAGSDGAGSDGARSNGAGANGARGVAGLGIAGLETGPAAGLRLRRVGHIYGVGTPWEKVALEDVDLEIKPREGTLVVGDNGSGKSTLAWIMAGLLRPTTGECLLGDEPVRTRIGSVALAFQHARLQLQRATVGRDVRAAGAPDDEAVAAALAAVGLDPEVYSERRIDALSGGQQRRVALAGLLARRPSVLVLDEPLAGLDQPSRDGLLDLLATLRRDHGLTLVVISHDLEGMERVCDRVVQLERGRIVGDSALTEASL